MYSNTFKMWLLMLSASELLGIYNEWYNVSFYLHYSRLFEICFHFAGHRSLNFCRTYIFYVKLFWSQAMSYRYYYFSLAERFLYFNFISTGRCLKIGRPVTIQNKPKSWNHAPNKSNQIQLGIPSNFEKFTRFKT